MANTGEWIEHDGKGMPVGTRSLVKVKISIEGDDPFEREGEDTSDWFDSLRWWDAGSARVAITHYRIVKENQDA